MVSKSIIIIIELYICSWEKYHKSNVSLLTNTQIK